MPERKRVWFSVVRAYDDCGFLGIGGGWHWATRNVIVELSLGRWRIVLGPHSAGPYDWQEEQEEADHAE